MGHDWLAWLLTPTGARWELHVLLAILLGGAVIVGAGALGFIQAAPYAGVAMVGIYVLVLVLRARGARRPRRHFH